MAFKLTSGPNALKISKAQQTTILEVLIASLLVGAAFMFSIWLIRYISFNTKVITAKGESVDNYEASVINTGACDDSNGDGKLSDSELDSCTPDSTPLATVPSSLRSNVMVTTANSPALESVQRSLASSCYDAYGEEVNYLALYERATNDSEREYYLSLYQTCSALRVIPDALPSTYNVEAAMASLNYLFNVAGVTPEAMNPEGSTQVADLGNGQLMSTGINFTMQASERDILNMLETIERSIRNYTFNTASIDVSNNQLSFSGLVDVYYVEDSTLEEDNRTVRANDTIRKDEDDK